MGRRSEAFLTLVKVISSKSLFKAPQVRLTGGPLYDRLLVHTRYLRSIDPDRLLARYRTQAGLDQSHRCEYRAGTGRVRVFSQPRQCGGEGVFEALRCVVVLRGNWTGEPCPLCGAGLLFGARNALGKLVSRRGIPRRGARPCREAIDGFSRWRSRYAGVRVRVAASP